MPGPPVPINRNRFSGGSSIEFCRPALETKHKWTATIHKGPTQNLCKWSQDDCQGVKLDQSWFDYSKNSSSGDQEHKLHASEQNHKETMLRKILISITFVRAALICLNYLLFSQIITQWPCSVYWYSFGTKTVKTSNGPYRWRTEMASLRRHNLQGETRQGLLMTVFSYSWSYA